MQKVKRKAKRKEARKYSLRDIFKREHYYEGKIAPELLLNRIEALVYKHNNTSSPWRMSSQIGVKELGHHWKFNLILKQWESNKYGFVLDGTIYSHDGVSSELEFVVSSEGFSKKTIPSIISGVGVALLPNLLCQWKLLDGSIVAFYGILGLLIGALFYLFALLQFYLNYHKFLWILKDNLIAPKQEPQIEDLEEEKLKNEDIFYKSKRK